MFAIDRARRALLALGLAGLAVSPRVQAAEQRYAVLSLIGDRVAMVGWRPATGSNLDRNERDAVRFNDGALDKLVLLAVDDALRRARPGATPVLLAARDPKLYRLQDQMLEQGGDAGELLAAVKGLLAQAKATRLVLVTKYRADAQFQLTTQFVGAGKISGLGFYVDEAMRVTLTQTGQTNFGFVAPYAFVAVSLIDVESMRPIRQANETQYFVFPTSASQEANRPWEVLTPKQKVDALERLIHQAVAHAMPELLAAE